MVRQTTTEQTSKVRIRKPGPKSKKIWARDETVVARSMRTRFFPLVVEEGNGVLLKDPDGNEYLDFMSMWCVAGLGYSHPAVVEAVKRQLDETFPVGAPFPSEPTVKLAEKLLEIVPGSDGKKVWFGHSGTDACDLVTKLVPRHTNRSKMISFLGGTHGMTMGGLSISGFIHLAKYEGIPNTIKVPYPYRYRCLFCSKASKCTFACLDYIKDVLFKTICPPEDTAFVMIEPIQSSAGVIIPPDDYLRKLKSVCKEYGIQFICDEVKVGYARTGKMFAIEHSNVEPDGLVLGKSMAGGMPLGAVIAEGEILDTGTILSSLGGNPVSCAAGLATLEVIQKHKLADNATSIGRYMKKRLDEMKEKHRLIGDVRGLGLTLGLELVSNRTTKQPATFQSAKVCYRAWELGVIVSNTGAYQKNVIEVTPPLIINKEQADRGLDLLERALSDVEAGMVSDEKVRNFSV